MIDVEKLIDTLRRLYPSGGYVVDCGTDPPSLRWAGGNDSKPTIEYLLSDECQASLPTPAKTWTCREFLLRFTAEERQAIIVAGRSHAAVEDLRSMLLSSPEIHSNAPELLTGMASLVAAGLLTPERHDQILG